MPYTYYRGVACALQLILAPSCLYSWTLTNKLVSCSFVSFFPLPSILDDCTWFKIHHMSELVLEKQEQRRKPRKQKARSWEELYQALSDFQREHGHCNVPKDHNDSGLCWWIAEQRRTRHLLTKGQRSKLELIGLNLSTIAEQREERWNAKYERLKEFRLVYAHCNVPQTAQFDEELEVWSQELGYLVQDQRQHYRKGKMSEKCQQKLREIGFEFSIKPHKKQKDRTKVDEQWHESYLQL